jgi:protein TonB
MAFSFPAGALNLLHGRQAMFEDSTFESTGRIHTRSRRWMIAVFLFNTSILLAMILFPLLCPQALPPQAPPIQCCIFIKETPPVPPPTVRPEQTVQSAQSTSQMQYGHLQAPRGIPAIIYIPSGTEPKFNDNIASWDPNSNATGRDLFNKPGVTVVHPATDTKLRVSTSVEEGLLIHKTMPFYPAIARAARVEGTVRLAATISKTGSIENVHVASGPAMLQQSALEAVSTWRYKPYLLDGEPVEVETTVEVIFTLSR